MNRDYADNIPNKLNVKMKLLGYYFREQMHQEENKENYRRGFLFVGITEIIVFRSFFDHNLSANTNVKINSFKFYVYYRLTNIIH